MKCLLDTANGFTVVMKKLLFKLFVLIAFFFVQIHFEIFNCDRRFEEKKRLKFVFVHVPAEVYI